MDVKRFKAGILKRGYEKPPERKTSLHEATASILRLVTGVKPADYWGAYFEMTGNVKKGFY